MDRVPKLKIRNKILTRLEHGLLAPQASTLSRYYGRDDKARFNMAYQVWLGPEYCEKSKLEINTLLISHYTV
jgi:hypothetical protein